MFTKIVSGVVLNPRSEGVLEALGYIKGYTEKLDGNGPRNKILQEVELASDT